MTRSLLLLPLLFSLPLFAADPSLAERKVDLFNELVDADTTFVTIPASTEAGCYYVATISVIGTDAALKVIKTRGSVSRAAEFPTEDVDNITAGTTEQRLFPCQAGVEYALEMTADTKVDITVDLIRAVVAKAGSSSSSGGGVGTITGPVTSTQDAIAVWNAADGTVLANTNYLIQSNAITRTGGDTQIFAEADDTLGKSVVIRGGGSNLATAGDVGIGFGYGDLVNGVVWLGYSKDLAALTVNGAALYGYVAGTAMYGFYAPAIAKTSQYDMVVADLNNTFTNAAATAEQNFRLSSAFSLGQCFRYECRDADGLRITMRNSQKIRMNGTLGATNGYISTTEIGATAYLVMNDSSAIEWTAVTTGTWTVDGTIVPEQTIVGPGARTVTGGTGSPEGVITASIGSLYLRSNGGTSTTLYVKESGSGNTGWVNYSSTVVAYVTCSDPTAVDITSPEQTLTLSGNTTFGAAAGGLDGVPRTVEIEVIGDGSTRTLTFDSDWLWYGTKPASLAANTKATLTLKSTTNASDGSGVVAIWTLKGTGA